MKMCSMCSILFLLWWEEWKDEKKDMKRCEKRKRMWKKSEEESGGGGYYKKNINIVVYCIDCVWYKLCEIVRIIKCLSYLFMVVVWLVSYNKCMLLLSWRYEHGLSYNLE